MRKLLVLVVSAALLVLAPSAFAATVTGTGGDDTLIGTASADVIKGLAGDDSAWGRRGADVLRGGAGDDTLEGQRGRDHLEGGAGADRLFGQRGKDLIVDAHGPDVDMINGGRRADHIFANFNDTVFGGTGNDLIEFVYPASGQVSCGAGYDTVIFNQPYDDMKLFDCEKVQIKSAGRASTGH